MELKIANCYAQVDFDEVAKLLLAGWKIATNIKNNGITGTQENIIYHLIKFDPTNADDVAKAAEFLHVEKKEIAPVLASGIADIDAMQFFDTEAVPSKVTPTEGWRPLSKDHVYAKGAWLIKLKVPAVPVSTGAVQ